MKARIPKHREFVIQFPENYDKSEECWGKLQQIMNDMPYLLMKSSAALNLT